MADVEKTVEVIFSTTLKDGGAGLKEFGDGMQSFSQNVQDVLDPLDKLAGVVKLVDTAIVGLGIAFAGKALSAAGQFNQQIAETGTLFGATEANLKTLSSGVLDYGVKSAKSIDDINVAVYKAISAGVAWGDSLEFLTSAEKLSVAGKADLTDVTLALTGTMNAYGAKVSEAGEYSDKFIRIVQQGQTTLPELAQSLSQVTSTAAAGKVSFSEIGAAVAALTSAGIKTPEAMTAIKAALSAIIQPTKEAEDAAKALGIKFDANALAAKGLSGVFAEVQAKTGGSVEKISQLFSSMEALKAVTVLGTDASGNYAKSLLAMKDSAGATEKAFGLLADSWDNTTQRLSNNVNAVLITVGSKLGPEFSSILNGLTSVFTSVRFALNEGAFDSVFKTLESVFDEISGFLKQLADNLPAALAKVDFSKFNSSILNLTNSIGGIFDGIDLATPDGLAKAIQLVTDTIATLLNQGAGIAQVWGNLLQEAMPLIEAFASMSQETATSSGKLLGLADVISVLVPAFASLGKGIEAIGTGLELIGSVQIAKFAASMAGSTTVVAGATSAAYGLGAALGPAVLGGAAAAAGYGVGTVLAKGLDTVIDKLTGSGSLGGLIYDLTHDTEDLGTTSQKASGQVKELGTALNDVGEGTAKSAAGIDSMAGAVTRVATGLRATGVKDFADTAVDAAVKTNFFARSADTLKAAAEAMKPPVDGAKLGIGQLREAAEESKSAMHAAAKSYLDSADALGYNVEAHKAVRAEYEKLEKISDPVTAKTKKFSDQIDLATAAAKGDAKALLELTKVSGEYAVKMEQIASNERIKNIEAKVSLDIANVQANAQTVIAAFESINVGIESTGDTLQSLFGLFDDLDKLDSSARMALFSQISKENERRDKEFELQRSLVETQIENLRAQTRSLQQGQALIKIDGAGLQPHLEAFMWEILKAVQIRANQDGLKLLLGVT